MSASSPDHDPDVPQFLKPRQAAERLGLGYPGPFNALRRKFERYVDCPDGAAERLLPVPDFHDRVAERAWRQQHIVKVPPLGGVSYFGGDFRYDAAMIDHFRKRGN